MEDKVVVPLGRIDEDALMEFVEHLEKLTLAEIHIDGQFVISCPGYPGVIDALKQLMPEAPAKTKTSNAPKPSVKAAKKVKVKGQAWKTWSVYVDGIFDQKLTKGEKSKLLKDGGFAEGTVLVHPREGKFSVEGEKGKAQKLVPMEGAE